MNKKTIDPSINLLIFDMDGTITSSLVPTYEAIKRAFSKLNLSIQISEKEVEKYFGASSDEFYQAITPIGRISMWQEVRTNVRQEYESTLREYGKVFPGVKETLSILRKRGYRLILFSNSSIKWFKSSIDALQLDGFFDHVECVEESGMNKTTLIKKFKNQFRSPKAAVIGDRVYDIQAAKETNSMSVGVLFGYGGREPEEADFTIAKFSALLDIFNRRLPIFERVLQEVLLRKKNDRAFTIGITGIDTSGKTRFAEELAEFVKLKSYNAQIIYLDDFHNSKETRYSGKDQAENYYLRSFDIPTIIKGLLIPVQKDGKVSTRMTLLDLHSDKYEVDKQYFIDENTIILFEGVFLFRNESSSYLDYKIFLEISFEESKRRAAVRDIPIYGEEILERYDRKYLPAQRKYLDEYPPMQTADLIIDNSNWEFLLLNMCDETRFT